MVRQSKNGDVGDYINMLLGSGQTTNGKWRKTVICCWDVVSQSTNGDVGDVRNMLMGCGQSGYRWGCAG